MDNVTLDTIGNGALLELFSEELARVLANIADPNTEATTKRAITVTVSFKPKSDREIADVDLKCSSKLAGIVTVQTRVFMGRRNGRLIAVEDDPRQSNLFDQQTPTLAAVASFNAKGGEE